MRELYEATYKVFHPFIGLVSWKKRGIVSAFQHSLNTAAIAHDIANLLTDDMDVTDVATYCGLLHDVYQKAKSVDESLTREKLEKVISHTLEDIGLERHLIKKVLEGCDYNVAENPGLWLDKYSIAAASIHLADIITSADDAFEVVRKLREEATKEVIKEVYDRLRLDILSIFIPQVMLRSLLYQMAIENVQERLREAGFDEGHALFILAKNGLVIITKKEVNLTWPIEVDYMNLKKRIGVTYFHILDILKKGSKRDPESWARPGRFAADSDEAIEVDYSIKSSFFGIRLVGVRFGSGGINCIICGSPVVDPTRPTLYGRIKYNEASTERWSPRYPGCINLNEFLQRWERNKVFICPLCVLEAFVQRKVVIGYEQKPKVADYVIQLFFTKPTHYEVARYMSALAQNMVKVVSSEIKGTVLKLLIYEPWEVIEKVEASKESLILLDFTWASYLTLVESVSKRRGERAGKELEDFVGLLPDISKAIIMTGVYPFKFTLIPDPAIERRPVMPVRPLYDYDVNDVKYGRLIPLTLFSMTLLHELNGDREVGEKAREAKIRSALNYLDYPFWTAEDILMKHYIGREVLHAYDAYIKDPYVFTFKK